MKLIFGPILVAWSLATTAALAQPEPLYRVELIAPTAGGAGQALAVNASGDVAGEWNGAAFIQAGHFTRFAPVRTFDSDGSITSTATAINRFGLAAGHDGEYMPCVMSGLEMASAATFAGGKMRFIDSEQSMCSFEADGINDRGTIVGIRSYRGFVRYADGRELEVKPLSTRDEWNGTRASAIDNEGRVVGGTTIDVTHVPQVDTGVGYQATGDGPTTPIYGPDLNAYVIHAFLLTITGEHQHMRDLGALRGYPDTYATALNEDLTIVGYSGTNSGPKWTRVSGPSHAWVWQRGRMTDLGGSRATDSFAYGVNGASVIVGCSAGNAVRWVDKHMQDLNMLIDPRSGWHLTCARAINRDGIIVGSGSYGHSAELPVRLVPLHEPISCRRVLNGPSQRLCVEPLQRRAPAH